MYEDCITCKKLGESCDGPNFVAMTSAELVAWCKARKTYLGLSNARIAELSNMSKGTIDGLLASAHADFRYESIRPLMRVLVGGKISGDPCPDPNNNRIKDLEAKNENLTDALQHLKDQNKQLHEEAEKAEAKRETDTAFLRDQVKHANEIDKSRKRTITVLGVLLGISVVAIIAALVLDVINPNAGFFWLKGAGNAMNL